MIQRSRGDIAFQKIMIREFGDIIGGIAVFDNQATGDPHAVYQMNTMGESIKNIGGAKPLFANGVELLPQHFFDVRGLETIYRQF